MGHDHDHDHDHGTGHRLAEAGTGADALAWVLFDVLAAVALGAAAVAYAAGMWRASHRSPWSARRAVAWYLGLVLAAAGLLGPLAAEARSGFTAHMAVHLLVGMVAPLLLVLGAPVALTLRALPVGRARSLTRVLRGQVVRAVTHPVLAATLNAGGMWLLYTTDLYRLMHTSALLHGVVHAHIFLAGYVLTASLVGRDPDPHRSPVAVRAGVLIVFIAAHSVLAKWLYAHPPAGVDLADGRVGAQLMYYGGDVVDVIIIVLLLAGWYTSTDPRRRRASYPPSGQVSKAASG
ncbi:cytochrome c oxidase assembly protein [Ornithinimicrobium murale]|uniref:cytochrome c oxidase assembly protein n=1 Tax=Ornithinimicrobium murale TaxID=1050153 RepID=UPI001EDDDA23|nr:cytochrome c oxidase assembly protein [Ornithinimicrobium murale]